MSGHSGSTKCPNCGAEADEYTDWKPFNYTSITCYECGLMVYPTKSYMALEALNESREENELEPLEKLPAQSNNLW